MCETDDPVTIYCIMTTLKIFIFDNTDYVKLKNSEL